MRKKRGEKYFQFIWLAVFGLVLFATLNKHARSEPFTYHGEIWSDKAGYYMFLPATFRYDFKARQFPDSIDLKTGEGFKLDRGSNKVLTKYPVGVAILQAPFYLLAEAISPDHPLGAFDPVHHKAIDFAAAFYLTLGLWFLWMYLRQFIPDQKMLMVYVLTIWAGTNLFHYSVVETGLSHVYSFAAFSALLYLQRQYVEKQTRSLLLWIGLVCGIILSVRWVNAAFIPLVMALDQCTREWVSRKSLWMLPTLVLPLIPQFMYWKYMGRDAGLVSYVNEGFDNMLSPKVFNVLFAPENGWLLYTPLALLWIYGVLRSFKADPWRSSIVGISMAGVLLLYSTWWSWQLGCGFGHRGFVDHYALFSIPLVFLINRTREKRARIVIWSLIAIAVIYNLKLTYTYDYCWYGQGAWDWGEYLRLLISSTK